MFIQTQETPNPNTMKFIPGIQLLSSGIKSYSSAEEATSSLLARALFDIEGVVGVFITESFVSVTKRHEDDWSYLRPIVLAGILDHITSGLPIVEEEKKEVTQQVSTNDEVQSDVINAQIVELIEKKVRPAVAQDGGDIVFKDYKDGIVYVELHGACSGCPSSTITLKNGIENMLKHYIPQVREVQAV